MKKTCAIIVAAGKSTRMGQNKQLIPIAKTTVIEYCLNQFQNTDAINAIVVVTSPELIPVLHSLNFSKIHKIVVGGNTRQESVLHGLDAVPEDCEFIAIHDGARPFAAPTLINSIIASAQQVGAAVPVIPVTSTVKRIDSSGKITETVDRDCLRLVQTPQVFEKKRYRQAIDRAIADRIDLTDDCQLFERLNWPIAAVNGSEENIKLTTPADIALAQIIAKRMNEDENWNRI